MGDANSSGSESSTLDEGEFVIEAIVGHRKVDGIYEYELKWKGYDTDENTWQTADTFNESSIQLLEDYNRQHKVGMKKKKKEEKPEKKRVRTPPKKRQFYEEKAESSDAEKKAGWFVSKDAEHKEIKGLYVQDRIMTSSEQLLAAVTQDDGGVRRTRSVMRQLMGDDKAAKPKRKRASTSAAPASRKRAASPKVPKKPKKRSSDQKKTPPKKRARRSNGTSSEASEADESSAAEESNETLDGSGGKESDDDDCVIIDDIRTETPESVASTSTVENRRPVGGEKVASKKKVEKPKEQPKEKSKEKAKEKLAAEKPPVQKPPSAPKQPTEKPETPEVFRIPKKKKWDPFVDVHAEPAVCKPTHLAKNLASSAIPIFAPTKASAPQRPVVNQPPAIGSNVRTSFVASTPRPREVPKEKPNPPPASNVQSTAADLLALVSKDSPKAQEPRVAPIVASSPKPLETPLLSPRDPRRVQPAAAAAPPSVVRLTPHVVNLSVGHSTPNGPPAIPTADNNNQADLTYADLEKYALEGNVSGVQAALNSRLAHTFDYSAFDVGRRTLLHRVAGKNCSVQHEYDEILACLVSQKASMEVIDGQRGQTALHIAVCNRHACLVRKLLELGSPINTVDREGFSPLGAALKLHPPVAAELLRQGANFSSVLENAKLRFTPEQLQPVHDFVRSISAFFAREQEEILSDHFAQLCPISTIHQVRMGESNIFEFAIPFCSPNSCEVSFVMFARPQYVGERIHSVEMKERSPVEKVFLDGVPVLPFSHVNFYIFLIRQRICGQYPHRLQVVVDPNAEGPLWIQLLASKKEVECSDPQPVPPPPSFDYGQ